MNRTLAVLIFSLALTTVFCLGQKPPPSGCSAQADCTSCTGTSVQCSCHTSQSVTNCSCEGGSCEVIGSCVSMLADGSINTVPLNCTKRKGNQCDGRPYGTYKETLEGQGQLRLVSFDPQAKRSFQLGPNIEIETDKNSPVQISDPTFDIVKEGLGLTGLKYRVLNQSDKPIVAFEIEWEFFSGTTSTKVSGQKDYYLSREVLAPGGSIEQDLHVSVASSQTPFDHVVGRILLVEFNDGSRSGSNATEASLRLWLTHQQIKDAYAELARRLQAKSLDQFLAEVKGLDTHANPGLWIAKSRVLEAYAKGGSVAVGKEISRSF